ncbi:hypothetical protein LCGC14_2892030 [marine sediment metagenome]|uniref:Uncharacterized protein n=1 Tax=marine sediment metagenome TaxID=412755 RepID=A0A0F9A4V8_9ZZZZ
MGKAQENVGSAMRLGNNFKRLLAMYLAGFVTAAALYGFVTVYQAIRADAAADQQRTEQELREKDAAVDEYCKGAFPLPGLEYGRCHERLMRKMI